MGTNPDYDENDDDCYNNNYRDSDLDDEYEDHPNNYITSDDSIAEDDTYFWRYPGREFLTFGHQFLACLIATEITGALTYPFTVITRRRTLRPEKYRSNLFTIKEIFQKEGTKGLFRGLKASLASQGFNRFFMLPIFFSGLEKIENHRRGSVLVTDRISMAIGAGLSTMLITYPIDVVLWARESTEEEPKRIRHIARDLYKESGVRGLYSGLAQTMAKTVFRTSFDMATYHQTQSYLSQEFEYPRRTRVFLAAGFTGLVSALLMTPVERVIEMFLAEKIEIEGEWKSFKTTWEAMKQFYEKLGFRGLYRNFGILATQGTLSTILVFVVRDELYEAMSSEEFIKIENKIKQKEMV